MAWAFSLFMGGTVTAIMALSLASSYARLPRSKAKTSGRFNARGHSEALVWFIYSLSLFFILSSLILLSYPLLRLKIDGAQAVLSLSVKKSAIFMYSILGAGVVVVVLTGIVRQIPEVPVQTLEGPVESSAS